MRKVILSLLCCIFLMACVGKHVKVHTFSSIDSTGGTNDIIYWYLIYGSNNQYYYYNSRVPVTNFDGITWSSSTGAPAGFSGAQELGSTTVESTSLPDNVSNVSEAETSSEADASSEAGNSSEGGSSSEGSSDGGSSGDGGGDGGGGGGD